MLVISNAREKFHGIPHRIKMLARNDKTLIKFFFLLVRHKE